MNFVSTGASFAGRKSSTNVSDVLRTPSLAMTLRLTAPSKFLGGVPLNVWVAALNVSQAGSAAPLASVAR